MKHDRQTLLTTLQATMAKTPSAQRIPLFLEIFDALVKNEDCDGVLEALQFLRSSHLDDLAETGYAHTSERGLEQQRADVTHHLELLREIFWRIPAATPGAERDCFLPARLAVIEQLLRASANGHDRWDTQPQRASVFRFIVAVSEPKPGVLPVRDGETEDDRRARGRYVDHREQKRIRELLIEHFQLTVREAEQFLDFPGIPPDLQHYLVHARLRSGGVELGRSDVRNARVLDPFYPCADGRALVRETRSPEAERFLGELAAIARNHDLDATFLAEIVTGTLSSWNGGKTPVIVGHAAPRIFGLSNIGVDVTLDEAATSDVVDQVFTRLRAMVSQWRVSDAPKGPYRVTLTLQPSAGSPLEPRTAVFE